MLKTTGIDFGVDYVLDVGAGELRFDGDATYTNKYEFDGVDSAGLLSQNFGMLAKWRPNLRTTWSNEFLTASVNWQDRGGRRRKSAGIASRALTTST